MEMLSCWCTACNSLTIRPVMKISSKWQHFYFDAGRVVLSFFFILLISTDLFQSWCKFDWRLHFAKSSLLILTMKWLTKIQRANNFFLGLKHCWHIAVYVNRFCLSSLLPSQRMAFYINFIKKYLSLFKKVFLKSSLSQKWPTTQ